MHEISLPGKGIKKVSRSGFPVILTKSSKSGRVTDFKLVTLDGKAFLAEVFTIIE